VLQEPVLAVRLVLAVGLAVTDGRGGQLGWLRQLGELWLRPVAAAAHQDFHLGSLDYQDHPSIFCTCLKFFMILYMFEPLHDVLQTSSTVIENKFELSLSYDFLLPSHSLFSSEYGIVGVT